MSGVGLLIVGGGRMGSALLGGLLEAGTIAPESCAVVEASASQREALVARFAGVRVEPDTVPAEAAVLAVKPADVAGAAALVAASGATRVLSILAGVPIARLESLLPAGTAVIRAMPNTPALVGSGASAIAGGSAASGADLDWAETILGAVGVVVRLPESKLDAVTGLSGSGPAYVFLVAEALIDAGVLAGLDRPVARELVVATLLGSARLLAETGEGPEALRAQVTSPGGTTAAGLQVLERAGLRGAIADAVLAATARSLELGSGH